MDSDSISLHFNLITRGGINIQLTKVLKYLKIQRFTRTQLNVFFAKNIISLFNASFQQVVYTNAIFLFKSSNWWQPMDKSKRSCLFGSQFWSEWPSSECIQGPNAGIPQVLIRSWQPLSTQAANQLVQSTTPTKPIWKQSKSTKLFSAHQSVATVNFQPNANWPNKTKLINETESLKVGIVKLNNLKRVAIESLWRYSAS